MILNHSRKAHLLHESTRIRPTAPERSRTPLSEVVTMTEASSANLEMAIVLPLGVVCNQLMRIEADLRLLNMKALDFAKGRENGRHTGLISARLENINEALDSIRDLVSDIESDIQPIQRSVTRNSTKRHTSDVSRSEYSDHKPYPDRDD